MRFLIRARDGQPTQFLGPRTQAGQTIVLMAFMIIVLFAAVGIAVDAGTGYYWNTSAERAAAAAALSGVIFMPSQFTSAQAIPIGSGADASDRAVAEALRNGFDTGDVADQVVVTPAPVPGSSNKLAVTVSRRVGTFFMQIFGISNYTVSRTAIATYLPPLSIGQPGATLGSTVSQLGNGGYYIMRTEGWRTDRGQGDAYTPNPSGVCIACPSTDIHALNAVQGTDLADPSLPARGGYDFKVTIPAGSSGRIQVYNAAFAPDGGGAGPNFCENWKAGFPQRTCSPGGKYHMHEDDCCNFNYSDKTTYSTMEYTIFNASSVFIRNSDQKISQMKVRPVDARNWNNANNQYTDPANTGNMYTQTYDAVGAPTNMGIYHAWVDVGTYGGDPAFVSYTAGPLGGALGPGTYRLRVDTLDFDGNGSTGNSQAHKGFAVRVADATGTVACGTCSMSAIDEMAIYTPVQTPAAGGAFQIPLFQLPPDYAGKTISVDLFDVGDMGGCPPSCGQIYIGVVDPRTGLLADVSPNLAPTYNLRGQRSNYGTGAATLIGNVNPVETLATDGGSGTFIGDNNWIHFDIPIPNNYNPGANPNNWWWSLQYRTTSGVSANDTITVALALKGNPAHLLQS